jgi:hypothetical protein
MASTVSASTSPPRLHVTVQLPPVISFSSIEKPQLEVHLNLQYSQPIIIALKHSRLWPLHLQSALTLDHASSGRPEYLPRVDGPTSGPPIPRLTQKHKDDFLGLRPGETSVVQVSFRPYNEPYDYQKFKDKGIERYRMLFPIGMQFLKPGEEYEIGGLQVQNHAYMIGDLEEIVAEATDGVEWKSAEGSLEIVAGERCRFRVEA